MSGWLGAILRPALGLALGAWSLPWVGQRLILAWNYLELPLRDLPWLLGGSGLGLVLAWIRRPNAFLHTAIHETCHALVATLLGVRVRDLRISQGRGGMVVHDRTDPIRSTLIALAPYCLPLLLGPVLIARWWWPDPPWLTGLGAWLVIQHLHGLWYNVRQNFFGQEADLTRIGKLLSLVLIVTCLGLLLEVCLRLLAIPV